jgi:signal transduction histidine kinase
MRSLDRLVQYALTADADDVDRHRRTKFALAATTIFFALAIVRMLQFTLSGNLPQAITLAVCAAITLSLPFVFRRTQSLAVIGHALSALVFFGITRAAWVSGGAGSPALVALAVIPPVAVFIAGRRAGIVWAVIIGVVVLAFAALDRTTAAPVMHLSAQTVKAATATGAFALMITTLVLAFAYERARESTILEAAERVARVERRANELDADRVKKLHELMEELAHEGNNTLSFVTADLSFAERTTTEPEVREALGEAYVGTLRLKEILHDVQTLTRPVAPPHSVPCDVREIIESSLAEAAPLLDRLGVKPDCALGDDPVLASVSPRAVALALRTLIGACVPEEPLRIRVSAKPIEIRVEGSGGRPRDMGIHAAQRELEPYGATLHVDCSSTTWRGVIRFA